MSYINKAMERFDLKKCSSFLQTLSSIPKINSVVDQVAIDSRRIHSSNSVFVALEGEWEDGHRFVPHAAAMGARFAIVKEDYVLTENKSSIQLLRVKSPLKALQEIACAYRQSFDIPIIAIGGSYGKTMLKDLLQSFLGKRFSTFASPESFNSQIGVALSLLSMGLKNEMAIIEAGISKIGEMVVLSDLIKPTFAIITQIKETHLSTLKNLSIIESETLKLAENLPKGGWLLAPSSIQKAPFLKSKNIYWDQNDENLPHAEKLFLDDHKMTYQIKFPDKVIFKKTMRENFPYIIDLINLGIKSAWLLGINSKDITEVLENYAPETMHTEVWNSPQGATFINDTYSADPISIGKALKNLPKTHRDSKRIFIFDGLKNKNIISDQDFCHIGEEIQRAKINHLVLVGKVDYSALVKKVTENSTKTEISLFSDRRQAFHQISQIIKKDDVVLIKGSRKENLNDLAKEMTDVVRDNRLIVNLGAIRSNLNMIRSKLKPETRIMAMVKAFAYGTDPIIIGKFLERCQIDILGVAHVDEAIALRLGGIQQKIFVINAALYEIVKLVKHEFETGISDLSIVQKIGEEALRQDKKIKLHLHVDTGMSRLGCRPEEALLLAKAISNHPHLELEGLMTHFASAEDEKENSFTQKQLTAFLQVINELHTKGIHPRWIHAANSSAAVRFDFPFCNMARIGLALYGLHCSEATKNALNLRPALSLRSKIAGINMCRQGDSISYGRTYIVKEKEEKIAVIPLGYFDGIHRHYSGKGSVMIHGKLAPMIGTICMDFMMINVSNIENVHIGDSVLLFGEDDWGNCILAEEFAAKGGTNVHELITCLGPRIQRLFIDDEK